MCNLNEERGGACSTHGRHHKCVQNFGRKAGTPRYVQEGTILLEQIGLQGVHWIRLRKAYSWGAFNNDGNKHFGSIKGAEFLKLFGALCLLEDCAPCIQYISCNFSVSPLVLADSVTGPTTVQTPRQIKLFT